MNLDVWTYILSVMEEKEDAKMEAMKVMKLVLKKCVIILGVLSAQGNLSAFIHGPYAMERPTVKLEEMKVLTCVPKNSVKALFSDVLMVVGNVQTKQSV
jgi:hypothetical protein